MLIATLGLYKKIIVKCAAKSNLNDILINSYREMIGDCMKQPNLLISYMALGAKFAVPPNLLY